MLVRFRPLTGAAVTTYLLAVPAVADVTPQQVWDDIAAYMEGFGYAVSASERRDGDALVLGGVTMTTEFPENSGAFVFELGDVTLTPQDGGAVQVRFPEIMPMRLAVAPPDDDAVDLTLDYVHDGLDMLVSGTPERMVYDYTADSIGLVLREMVVGNEALTAEEAAFEMRFAPVDGTSVVSVTDTGRTIEQDVSLGELGYTFAFEDPDSEETASFVGRMAGVVASGSTVVPATGESDAADMGALMAGGLSGTGRFTHKGGETDFSVAERGGTTTGRTTSASGAIEVTFDETQLSYDVAGTGTTFDMTVPEMPFPVSAAMAESRFALTMPMAVSETPQDVSVALTLGGFTMSDTLWNIADPAGILPRDPATVAVDIDGKVTPFVDLYDPDAVAEMETKGAAPGELNAVTLRSLVVEAVGARLSGNGAFSFDNSDTETFDGFPKPSGQMTFELTGANMLIDRLIRMGVLSDEDAMGARMMMSMFAVPGNTPDALTSTIEINEAGQVLANGQRIR